MAERDDAGTDMLVRQLVSGFDALQEDYQRLFNQHSSLERKLQTARDQYNELAKLYGTSTTTTPPLSLSSSSPHQNAQEPFITAGEILDSRKATESATAVRDACRASEILRSRLKTTSTGVKIWSGPSADRPDVGSSMMPSISESPLEQDFTVEGTPSRLGCPFASMANKKLSSHAASIVSRYNQRGSEGPNSRAMSSVSRVNGRDSMSKRSSRRASFADPIKAEICGLSDHADNPPQPEEQKPEPPEPQEGAEMGVCPIRFLDNHSPEEVATYFEKHKHELPRSHEICVKRYQSNEAQIKELDEKYGNIVSMIQGLGKRHKEMLPEEPADDAEAEQEAAEEAESAAKVRKWASSVSAMQGENVEEHEEEEERQQHFERPLRDIRLGESPGRPWGIQVPAKFTDKPSSDTSSKPAAVASPPIVVPSPSTTNEEEKRLEQPETKAAARCPFGFDQAGAPKPVTFKPKPEEMSGGGAGVSDPRPKPTQIETAFKVPTFITPEPEPEPKPKRGTETAPTLAATALPKQSGSERMLFTGPVFIGYSAEDAAKILRESGLGQQQT
ncbi:hypothetical protein MBLNU230_g4634t1 [Neophaeotheca triangularis]